jgi:hypothetical protein
MTLALLPALHFATQDTVVRGSLHMAAGVILPGAVPFALGNQHSTTAPLRRIKEAS